MDNESQISHSVVFNTKAKFYSINYESNDILKNIKNLDISKAHGFDDTSIRMVNLCDDFLVKPLLIIFQNCINSGVFPESWKKPSNFPIHKANYKQLINNYKPVSLFPICSKNLKELFLIRFSN